MNAMFSIGQLVDCVEVAVPGAKPEPATWRLLRVVPSKELVIAERMQRHGVKIYLPQELRTRRAAPHHRKAIHGRKPVMTAIFPGLMFIADYDAGNVDRLRQYADGIVGLVRFGQEIATARAADMAKIRAIEAALQDPAQARRLKLGQRVRVIDGPFGLWEGRVARLDGQGRLRVLLEMLKREVPVDVSEDQIEAI